MTCQQLYYTFIRRCLFPCKCSYLFIRFPLFIGIIGGELCRFGAVLEDWHESGGVTLARWYRRNMAVNGPTVRKQQQSFAVNSR